VFFTCYLFCYFIDLLISIYLLRSVKNCLCLLCNAIEVLLVHTALYKLLFMIIMIKSCFEFDILVPLLTVSPLIFLKFPYKIVSKTKWQCIVLNKVCIGTDVAFQIGIFKAVLVYFVTKMYAFFFHLSTS